MAAACLEEMRGLAGLADRDVVSIASRLRDAKAAAAGRKSSANHYKMLGLPQTCSAEEVRRTRRGNPSPARSRLIAPVTDFKLSCCSSA